MNRVYTYVRTCIRTYVHMYIRIVLPIENFLCINTMHVVAIYNIYYELLIICIMAALLHTLALCT